jgi:hypothetical protein
MHPEGTEPATWVPTRFEAWIGEPEDAKRLHWAMRSLAYQLEQHLATVPLLGDYHPGDPL